MSDRISRIAVVDDDVDVLASMRFLLEVAGHHVATFACPGEFMALAATAGFTRVILDHHMPRTTGLELAAALREQGIELAIMLISGSLTPDIVARAQDVGVTCVAEKPVPEDELMRFLESA